MSSWSNTSNTEDFVWPNFENRVVNTTRENLAKIYPIYGY